MLTKKIFGEEKGGETRQIENVVLTSCTQRLIRKVNYNVSPKSHISIRRLARTNRRDF